MDLEMQQFLFDLQGYLVIEDVLSAAEVGVLKDAIAAQDPELSEGLSRFGAASGSTATASGFLDWGQPFCDLLDHEAILPILRFRLGDCFRLERIYGLHAYAGAPGYPLHADYGVNAPNADSDAAEYFPHRDNRVLNGFVVVAWSLAEAGPQQGGFCCIPGSHKSNFKVPESVMEARERASCVIMPPAPAGSVTLFSEALMHGTVPWTAEQERWTLLFKYCVSHLTWSNRRVRAPGNVELSKRQQLLFHEPGDPHRFFPSLFEGTE